MDLREELLQEGSFFQGLVLLIGEGTMVKCERCK